MEGCGETDLIDPVCGVCIVRRWVAGGLFLGMPWTVCAET